MRVLVVEDDEGVLDAVKAALSEAGGVVDTVSDGERGLFLACTNNYDLVILDLGLPRKNGKDVCRELRSRGKSMPILVLSVQSEVPNRVELLNIGADDFLAKPFSYEELAARARALARRPQSILAPKLSIADLILDTNEQTVQRGGTQIYLTRKEFSLLEFLLRNAGRTLSRAAILEHVWDMNADPFSNTLETHILNLRRKIDTQGKAKLIHTIPTRGYKIDVHG